MIDPPRPSSLGEILDRTAHLYRSRFLVFLGISLVPAAVVLTVFAAIILFFAWASSGAKTSSANPEVGFVAGALLIGIALLGLPIFVGVAALATGALNQAVSGAWRGERLSIAGAYKSVWPRGWRYIGLILLEALLIWAVPIAVWLAFFIPYSIWGQKGAMLPADTALFGFGVLVVTAALAGFAIWMLLRLSLAFPACVVEQIGAVSALKRSSLLSKGTKGRIILLYLLGGALNWLLSMSITIPLTIVLALLPNSNNPQHAETMAMILTLTAYGAMFAVQALTKPVYGSHDVLLL